MKLSKDDREFAAAVFYTHFRAMYYHDKDEILIRSMYKSFCLISERVKPIITRVIDKQYEQEFTVDACMKMLERIAGETVE